MTAADEARAEAEAWLERLATDSFWARSPEIRKNVDQQRGILRSLLDGQASRPITDEQVKAAADVVCRALEDGHVCTNFHVHESHKRVARAALEAARGVQS